MPHVRWGRFESYSKSEVFVKIAVLEIHSILRSMSTLRFFTEMQTSQNLFSEAELQRRMLLEISEFFLFQHGVSFSNFRLLLCPNLAPEIFSYLDEKSLFTGNAYEKQSMGVI